MNVLDALYHTVHDFDGGAEALAVRLGKRGTSLCHEVRPPVGGTAKAGLLDAVKIMEITHDYRTLHAMAARCGFMAVPLPHLDDDAHADTTGFLAEVAKEFSDVMQVVAAGAADGAISDSELAALERQWGELVAAGVRLLGNFTAKNAEGRSAHRSLHAG